MLCVQAAEATATAAVAAEQRTNKVQQQLEAAQAAQTTAAGEFERQQRATEEAAADCEAQLTDDYDSDM